MMRERGILRGEVKYRSKRETEKPQRDGEKMTARERDPAGGGWFV